MIYINRDLLQQIRTLNHAINIHENDNKVLFPFIARVFFFHLFFFIISLE